MKGTFRDYYNYIVYDDGRIYSKLRKRYLTNKIMKDGYCRLQLYNNNGCKMFNVHRIIAEVFIQNPSNKPFVNHIDGNKQNNRVENLEWCTQKENIEHAIKHGLKKRQEINTGPLCKQVSQYKDGKLINTYLSISDVYRQNGYYRYKIIKACKENIEAYGYYWKVNETSND